MLHLHSSDSTMHHHVTILSPNAFLMQVTALLGLRDLQAARLVCKQWHLGLSMGVTKLRPRMEANAVGLQWTELHKLQVYLGCSYNSFI